MEFQGIKNWEGLLDPLHDDLRREILRYGEFVEATYRCYDRDTSSPGYATCRYPNCSMIADHALRENMGYTVTKSLHATCGLGLPAWAAGRLPAWASTRSAWVGYAAVCSDAEEIRRLGRRDVVIAYRGTATCMEWIENLRARLTHLPPEGENCAAVMVEKGFLSLYTSRPDDGSQPSLRDSIRYEVRKILEEYTDEPLSITVTGHSLGAALAILTAHDITTSFKDAPLVTVFSFGGPRVGNRSFRRQLDRAGTKVLRIVNSEDPVTKVPGFVIDEEEEEESGHVASEGRVSNWVQRRVEKTQWVYADVGEELRVSSRTCPDLRKGNVATCHDLKTYLHLVESFVSSNCPIRATAKRVLKRRPDHGHEQLLFR
ncbi:phospholipase A(1) DAD1, chloroplastic-like [Andrographis paniculata]|uniref:phospholipase A(1) DAD1, chloroplastic-like n=1 Tax=Andrographis paniculata TaxID=175694 RepID=UPI0021E983DA|nr:phospholipase A(1) DAD1, chloroplastic-like [Andrographis paniculata]